MGRARKWRVPDYLLTGDGFKGAVLRRERLGMWVGRCHHGGRVFKTQPWRDIEKAKAEAEKWLNESK